MKANNARNNVMFHFLNSPTTIGSALEKLSSRLIDFSKERVFQLRENLATETFQLLISFVIIC